MLEYFVQKGIKYLNFSAKNLDFEPKLNLTKRWKKPKFEKYFIFGHFQFKIFYQIVFQKFKFNKIVS